MISHVFENIQKRKAPTSLTCLFSLSLSEDLLPPFFRSATPEAPKLCFTLRSLPALASFLYTKLCVCFIARSFTFLSFDFDLDLFPQSMSEQ
jgi:hypothetical protein